MKERAPAFQFYPKDWRSDPDVRTMNMEQRGVYWELIGLAWMECGLLDDPEYLRAAIGATKSEWKRAWPLVRQRFQEDPDRPGILVQTRLEKDRRCMAEVRSAKQEAGRKGGLKSKQTPSRGQAGASVLLEAKRSSPSASPSPSPPAAPASEEGQSNAADALRLFDQAAKDHALDDQQQQQGNKNSRQNRRQKP